MTGPAPSRPLPGPTAISRRHSGIRWNYFVNGRRDDWIPSVVSAHGVALRDDVSVLTSHRRAPPSRAAFSSCPRARPLTHFVGVTDGAVGSPILGLEKLAAAPCVSAGHCAPLMRGPPVTPLCASRHGVTSRDSGVTVTGSRGVGRCFLACSGHARLRRLQR